MYNYKEERFSLEAEGMQLPAALTLPEDGEAAWSIVLIPGSMANDVDGNYPSANMHPHMYADLGRQLAQRGHAVLRYARFGPDTGAQMIDKQQAERHRIFPRQQYIAAAACQKIRELLPQTRRLAISGHSEGSVHGLLLAQQHDLHIDAFISLSGPGYRYIDLFIHMARRLAEEQGEIIDFGSFKVNAAHYIRAFELRRAGLTLTDDIKADPTMAFFAQTWDSDTPEAAQGRQYMLDYDAIDPCEEIAKIPCPVLIVQGGLDSSGVIADNGERLYQARHAVHPDATARAFFPDLQHFYKHARPGMNSYESMMLDGETDEGVADTISSWLSDLN
jgi:uncharacterized protein